MDDPQAIVKMLEIGFAFVVLGAMVYMLGLAALSHTAEPLRERGVIKMPKH